MPTHCHYIKDFYKAQKNKGPALTFQMLVKLHKSLAGKIIKANSDVTPWWVIKKEEVLWSKTFSFGEEKL